MKVVKKISLLFCLILIFTSCNFSNSSKVKSDLENQLDNAINGNTETISEIITNTKSTNDNSNYTTFVTQMLSGLKYDILSVNNENDKINVILELTNKKIDPIIEDFFNTIVTESTNLSINGKPIDKEILFNSAIDNMLDSYNKSSDEKETIKLNLIYEKNNENKWELQNKNDYYEGLRSGLFEKINQYNDDKLPELYLNSFLTAFKKITPEQVCSILGDESTNSDAHIFTAKYYNYMDFKILRSRKVDKKTNFNIEIKVVDTEPVFNEFLNNFLTYYKETIVSKKTPTESDLLIKNNELLTASLENNKDKKITITTPITIDQSLKIVNLEDFFVKLLKNLTENSSELNTKMKDGLSNLFTE